MADHTAIEWTDSTVNPIRARVIDITDHGAGVERVGWHCEHVSDGCRNCYSEAINGFRGTWRPFKPGERFRADRVGYSNGEVKVFLDESALLKPLRGRKPRRIFWNSMTDLFGDWVPDAWIDRHFAVMALAPQHTFQVLTKRPERMRAYVANVEREAHWMIAVADLFEIEPSLMDRRYPIMARREPWLPLPNVWLGVSVENQEWAGRRIPELLATPAAVRFVSAEPLLGPIDLTPWLGGVSDGANAGRPATGGPASGLAWVIVGGESGPKARPMHPDWARSLRDQCQAAGVPFFFKQWGEWAPHRPVAGGDLGGDLRADRVRHVCADRENDGRYRRGDVYMRRLGKAQAGRLLDGREWNDLPSVASAKEGVPDDQPPAAGERAASADQAR